MENQYVYHTSAEWTVHHRGVVLAEGIPGIMDFSTPPEFGGEAGYWTPEHFLLAAVASCFAATFRGMAEVSKFEFQSIRAMTEGIIAKQDGSLRFTKIIIRVEATVNREQDRERAARLLEKAEKGCLIARSLSSEIVMEPKIFVEAPVMV